MLPNLLTDPDYSMIHILCPLSIVLLIAGFLTAIFRAIEEATSQLKRWHQIPCDRCLYFTGCQQLKCTVNPYQAFTEEAIFCKDFQEASSPAKSCLNCCKSKD
jgi:hypothetical protein